MATSAPPSPPRGSARPSSSTAGNVEFTVQSPTFGLTNWTLTGEPNPEDITGGRRAVVFAAKTPDHRGLTLTGAMTVELKEDSLEISRSGPGVSMKIQAKDCAQGGVFRTTDP